MSAPVRLAVFTMTLVIVFLVARAVGSSTGPVADPPRAGRQDDAAHVGGEAGDHGADHDAGDADADAAQEPGGLGDTEAGYTLRVLDPAPAGAHRTLRFVVTGPDAEPVTAYDRQHERRLHLVTIRRDATGYQHIHPTLAEDGTWTARLALEPGTTRLLADFTPTGGPELVLGTDLQVPGDYRPRRPAEVSATAQVDDYDVNLDGELEPGESSLLTATVTRGGVPVTDLQPYLGARGHLVALRESDLAYLHVHPDEAGGPGPDVGFRTEVPGPGRYRLFLEFRHGGRVHTAPFVLEAGEGHGHEH